MSTQKSAVQLPRQAVLPEKVSVWVCVEADQKADLQSQQAVVFEPVSSDRYRLGYHDDDDGYWYVVQRMSDNQLWLVVGAPSLDQAESYFQGITKDAEFHRRDVLVDGLEFTHDPIILDRLKSWQSVWETLVNVTEVGQATKESSAA